MLTDSRHFVAHKTLNFNLKRHPNFNEKLQMGEEKVRTVKDTRHAKHQEQDGNPGTGKKRTNGRAQSKRITYICMR